MKTSTFCLVCGSALGMAGLWLLELALLAVLDGNALVAAMLAPRPSLSMLAGVALVFVRITRLVVAPMLLVFVVARRCIARAFAWVGRRAEPARRARLS